MAPAPAPVPRPPALRPAALAGWLVTRALSCALLAVPGYPLRTILSDPVLYEKWSVGLAAGRFPVGDPQWQYPPLAGAVLTLPRLPGGPYVLWLMLGMLAADLLILVILLTAGERRPAGAWLWVAGPWLLGPMIYFRYDLAVTAVAVAALAALARGRLFGALAAIGALIKVWPAVLLFALSRTRARVAFSACGSFAAVAVVVSAAAAVFTQGPWDFLAARQHRGVEMEAVVATPLQLARAAGAPIRSLWRYGSWELVGPGVPVAEFLSVALTLAGLGLVMLLVLRRPRGSRDPASGGDAAFRCDTALVALLVMVVTSQVLSPQYLVWVLGVGAVCLTRERTRQRPVMVLVLVAVALTHLEFPLLWVGLVHADWPSVLTLTARNLVLVVATAVAVVRLRPGHGHGPRARSAGPDRLPAEEQDAGLGGDLDETKAG